MARKPRPIDPRDADRTAHYRRHAATQRAWANRPPRGPSLIERIVKALVG